MGNPKLENLHAVVGAFNTQFPTGTAVVVRQNGEYIRSVTTRPAGILNDEVAIVWVKDILGCVPLYCVTPLHTQQPELEACA